MIWVLIIGVAAVVAYFALTKNPNEAYASQISQPSALRIAGNDDYDFNIVGEASYQSNLEKIAGRSDASADHECTALLIPEPSNSYDANAIRVDINGMTVGYIPKNQTRLFQPLLNGRSASVEAVIIGGWDRGARGKANFGVKLDIGFPLEFAD